MNVLMFPTLESVRGEESGVRRVIEQYHKYGPKFGIDFVDCNVDEEEAYDLFVVHAGSSDRYPRSKPIAAIIHGLYWSADYNANRWEYKTNAAVIRALRIANGISVPSPWVAETIMRDMRQTPWVIPHGVDYNEWQHNRPNRGYVLWNKNRVGDVCTPEPMVALARERPSVHFVSTFTVKNGPENIEPLGVVPHDQMKVLVQEAAVYLSTTKETFGIGVLEAMAAGVPVLGFNHGGNAFLVQHGQTGYLARPGDYADLARGLDYCIKNRAVLGENAKLVASKYTWEAAMTILRSFFESTVEKWKCNQTPADLPEEYYHVEKN